MLLYSQQFTYQIIILVSKSNLLCLLCANHTEHATEPSTQRLLASICLPLLRPQ